MKALTDFWLGERNAETMWASWEAPHRKQILGALSCLPTVQSVYELGCGAGPNLRLIARARPDLKVGGSEPNEGLAAWASEHLGVTIDQAPLPVVPSAPWDVTVSCYTMAYVDGDTARQTLRDIQSRYLVIFEPTAHVAPFGPPGLYEGHAMLSYVHDYLALGIDTGWTPLWRWPFYPHHQGLNVVLILERV